MTHEERAGVARERLLHHLEVVTQGKSWQISVSPGVWLDDLDEIEAEAAARALTRVAEAVEGLPETGEYVGLHGLRSQVDRAAVLALLAPQADKET